MAATSLQTAQILSEFNTILNLHPEDGDHLCISEGVLYINRGGFLQGPTRTLYSLISEGYNYNDVTLHLETLKVRSEEFIQSLVRTTTDLNELKAYQRSIHRVASKLTDLKDTLRFIIPQDIKERFTGLFTGFKAQSDRIKAFINFNKPDGWQAPPKTIDINEPVRYRKLMHKIPKGVTRYDILNLAITAESQSAGSDKVSLVTCAALVTGFVATIPFSILRAVTLSTYRAATNQYDEGMTPTGWFLDNVHASIDRSHVDPRGLLNSYAMALLKDPVITDAHVDDFIFLARHIDSKFTETGPIFHYYVMSNDVDELLSMAQSSYFLHEFSLPHLDLSPTTEYMKAVLSDVVGGQFYTIDQFGGYLFRHFDHLQWIENPAHIPLRSPISLDLWKHGYSGSNDVEGRKAYYMQNCSTIVVEQLDTTKRGISLQNLLRIVDAISDNPRCTRFSVGHLHHRILALNERLTHYGFVIDELHDYIRQGNGAASG